MEREQERERGRERARERDGTVPHVVFIIEASDTNLASPKSATCDDRRNH